MSGPRRPWRVKQETRGIERTERIVRIGELSFRALSSTPVTDAASAPVILVHGIGVSHRYFSRLHEELARSGQVHSIDLPGYAGLPKPSWSLTVAEMSRALGLALDELGLEPAVLVGHSMGAQWVTELAVQRPDLVTHVVTMGPVTDSEHPTLLEQSIALGVDSFKETPAANYKIFTDYLFGCGFVWYAKQVGHMLRYRLDERVRELAVPLLVVRGGRDPIAGLRWCRRLRDEAPHGSLVVIPGHPHAVQHTAPRAVASAIHAFLRTSPTLRISPAPGIRTSPRIEEPMR